MQPFPSNLNAMLTSSQNTADFVIQLMGIIPLTESR